MPAKTRLVCYLAAGVAAAVVSFMIVGGPGVDAQLSDLMGASDTLTDDGIVNPGFLHFCVGDRCPGQTCDEVNDRCVGNVTLQQPMGEPLIGLEAGQPRSEITPDSNWRLASENPPTYVASTSRRVWSGLIDGYRLGVTFRDDRLASFTIEHDPEVVWERFAEIARSEVGVDRFEASSGRVGRHEGRRSLTGAHQEVVRIEGIDRQRPAARDDAVSGGEITGESQPHAAFPGCDPRQPATTQSKTKQASASPRLTESCNHVSTWVRSSTPELGTRDDTNRS